MSFLAKLPAMLGYPLGAFWRGVMAGSAGQWEGATATRLRRKGTRTLESLDAGMDNNVRQDFLSEARRLSQTFPVVRKINRQYANHCVGSCRMKWATGDPVIDKTYADAWQNAMRVLDLYGKHHFRKLTKIAVISVLRDGDIFGGLDRRGGILQVGCIEGDRVSTDGNWNTDTETCIGGVEIDGNGRATGIRVWDRNTVGTFSNVRTLKRAEYVHMFDSDRADAYRGVTHYHTVLAAVQDLKETLEAERLSAKRNSKLALLVKSIMGGAGAPAINLLGPTDNTTPDSTVNVQSISDVADAYMFPGESMESHKSERPSQGWQWLMEWLVREIAAGLDLPYGVVWHMSGLGGPATRFELSQANRVFTAFLQDILEPMWFRPIVGAWLSMEITKKRLPFHPKWYQFLTPRPAALTIDLGRDSKAGIAENEAGLTTATAWYAENDEDFETATWQLGAEAAYRKKVADYFQVPIEQIRNLQGGNPGATQQQPEPAKVSGRRSRMAEEETTEDE